MKNPHYWLLMGIIFVFFRSCSVDMNMDTMQRDISCITIINTELINRLEKAVPVHGTGHEACPGYGTQIGPE
jgi:hypothetical protein